MAFVWSKDLETGNSIIDQEHRTLIDAINDLMSACAAGKGRVELEKTCRFLQDYTVKHFDHEEQLQRQSQYPDAVRHKQYHEEFKRVVKDLSDQLAKEGPTLALVGKVNSSIAGWLLNHIKREDVKVAAHLKNVK